VALRERGRPLPAGAIALSPATDLAFTGESIVTRKHLDPFFVDAESTSIIDTYLVGNDPRNPLISPLYADLTGLPPLLLHVGSDEILLDDTVRFGNRAVEAGVDVNMTVWPQMFHVFQMTAPILPEAMQAIRQIALFIRLHLEDESDGIEKN
jgi:acetyl esterase/lipase